jgi:hypothetical protein
MVPMSGTSIHALSYFAIAIPRAEEGIVQSARISDASIRIAVLIGFVAAILVMAILVSDSPEQRVPSKTDKRRPHSARAKGR